jgi:y4mF family transcriptional regulator
MTIEQIGELIKKRRKMLQLTQEDLAEMAGVGLRALIELEKGRYNPSFAFLGKVASVLGLEIQLNLKEK